MMNGPTEFDVIGRLRTGTGAQTWAGSTCRRSITCGRYDEITPTCSEAIVAGIPDGRMVVFEDSAHVAHLEEPEAYAATVEEFLAGVEARAAA